MGYQTQQNKTHPERASPPVIQIECDPNCSAKKSNDHRNETTVYGLIYNYLEKMVTDPVAGFTGLLVVVTALLGLIARIQIKDSRAVQRAHIFVLSPQSELRLDNNGLIVGLRLWVIWKNSGTTPGSPVMALTGATWTPSIDQFQFGNISQEGVEQPFVLGPGAEIAAASIDISPAHVLANFNHQGFQLLWGWARYRDIFPGSKEHVVEFCFRVTIDGQLGLPPFTGRVNFAFHGEHNRYYDRT